MLTGVNKLSACPGGWYNGLQLCDHINGSFPASDGTLPEWQALLKEIKPVRFMWWVNADYWSTQGPVWAEAVRDIHAGVGKWFTWGPEDCDGIKPCDGRNVVVKGVGCAQGSWGSDGMNAGVPSGLASFGSEEYAQYLVDAFSNSWTKNLGIDGYTVDCSANYPCMARTSDSQRDFYIKIMGEVRKDHPQVVMSGEAYGSWDEVIRTNSQMGGQGSESFHVALQQVSERSGVNLRPEGIEHSRGPILPPP